MAAAAALVGGVAVSLATSLAGALQASADEPVPIDQEPRHRLMFSNAHVRFFDVVLPPGYRSLMHVHHHDGVFVNIAPSETLAEDWGQPRYDVPAARQVTLTSPATPRDPRRIA